MMPRDSARIDRWVRWFNRCVFAAAVWVCIYGAYSLAIDEPRPIRPTTHRKSAMTQQQPPAREPVHTYTTHAEIRFLEDLASKPNGSVLLRNYLSSAKRRTVWGDIDKAVAVRRAEDLLIDKVAL